MTAPGYDVGAAVIAVSLFSGAWLREKAQTFRLRNAALVSVMAFLAKTALCIAWQALR